MANKNTKKKSNSSTNKSTKKHVCALTERESYPLGALESFAHSPQSDITVENGS